MVDLGKKISWKTGTKSISKGVQAPSDLFLSFVKVCEDRLPKKRLMNDCELFCEQRSLIKKEYARFIEQISQESLLASFLIWIKESGFQDEQLLKGAEMLIEHGLIGVSDDAGHVWTIGMAKGFNHQSVIDAIRCQREWTLAIRENLVKTYLTFIDWLSRETYSYIEKVEDPDAIRTKGRIFPYSSFLSFIGVLPNEKARLVAGLLYYGGSRTLEEVLGLTLKNVDFDKKVIAFKSVPVSYPAHIFASIQALVHPRTSGKVFVGRQGSDLNPATIFRNFKEAAVKIGLGSLFTPAYLTANS